MTFGVESKCCMKSHHCYLCKNLVGFTNYESYVKHMKDEYKISQKQFKYRCCLRCDTRNINNFKSHSEHQHQLEFHKNLNTHFEILFSCTKFITSTRNYLLHQRVRLVDVMHQRYQQ